MHNDPRIDAGKKSGHFRGIFVFDLTGSALVEEYHFSVPRPVKYKEVVNTINIHIHGTELAGVHTAGPGVSKFFPAGIQRPHFFSGRRIMVEIKLRLQGLRSGAH
ncbi:MAG: alpha amylase C-terminal domain-containing protein [Bacteroidales bacterium]|nr:alpha amylase C-terminal domain-containing protein [Bacteroidales bacterium]